MSKVISIENLTKRYDLGVIGTGTLSRDLNRWWARLRGKPDPYTRIGQQDHFERIGESILALDDVSFKVEQGEALGIIGKNGAGKSTLLKILSRVTAPTSGVVKVKGRIGSLLEVGTGFHPELTGRENVYLNGAILGMRKEEVDRKFDEIVDFSGVEKFIDTPVKRYSSGMYVRLAFAVAAHLDPEILVVDEVLAVGDAEFQKKCLGKMGDVAGEGRTVLFVSHNMNSINTLCEKAFWIENGSIKTRGETSEVISQYLDSGHSESKNGFVDLEKWNNRYGDGQAKILSAKLLNEEGKINNKFYRTKPFKVDFVFTSNENLKFDLSMAIKNAFGANVLHLSAYDSPNKIHISEKGQFDVEVLIPSLPLFKGEYRLDIGIHHHRRQVPVDVVKNILKFIVEEPLDSNRPNVTKSEMFMAWAPSVWDCVILESDK
ncbi:MAG TPA: ABC transporter ATP-binding protein [Anaerolineaceae bacterium]|nr:ABC transporter ATP-binding protein [Anaerolineaceae bacterium]